MSIFKKKPIEPLRNCPFCGGSPRLSECGNQKEYKVYMCSYCYETPVQYHEARVSESGARKIWNQRAEEAECIIRTYKRVIYTLPSNEKSRNFALKHMLGV